MIVPTHCVRIVSVQVPVGFIYRITRKDVKCVQVVNVLSQRLTTFEDIDDVISWCGETYGYNCPWSIQSLLKEPTLIPAAQQAYETVCMLSQRDSPQDWAI